MTLSRRHVLHGAAACALPLALSQRSAFASKAEFRYKYANNLPATHPMNIRALQMSQAILAETGGRVDIQVFSNGQLGSDTDVLGQLRLGRRGVLHAVGPDPVHPGAGSLYQRRGLCIRRL